MLSKGCVETDSLLLNDLIWTHAVYMSLLWTEQLLPSIPVTADGLYI